MKNNNKPPLLNRFSSSLIKNKWIVIVVFIALIIGSVIGQKFVQKESDVISYLDDNTVTKQGLAQLQEEFKIIGDFTIGVSYLNESQVADIIKAIENSSGYKNYGSKLVWKGTFDKLEEEKEDLATLRVITPEQMDEIVASLRNKFVILSKDSNGNNVYTYVINIYFETANSDDETIAAIDEFEEIITEKINSYIKAGEIYDAEKLDSESNPVKITSLTDAKECYSFSGSAQNSRSLLKSSIGDMPKFVIAAVLAVFVILLLTTTSYLEPLIFLATLGISILLNMGTNIIAGIPMGRISSITASCATILQLAVAMDYAIFLMHTYYEELRATPNKVEAMKNALPKTIKSVVASSLTTVGGFIALFFMKFGIGYDLGFVLAKGVLLSLITVICLQPLIILFTDKLIMKTQHKWVITPRLKFMSKVITKKGVAIPIIAACIALLIPACIFQNKVDLTFITVNAENENPTVTEQVLEDSSNMLIVITPLETKELEKGRYKVIPDFAPQYDFIEGVRAIGFKQSTSFDKNKDYFVLSNGKYVETTIETNEEFDAIKDNVYELDGSANRVSDVFSLCALFDETITSKIDINILARPKVYPLLYSNFITNLDEYLTNDVDRYMLYTITIDGPKEDQLSYNTLAQIQKIANNTFGEGKVYLTGNVVAAQELSEVTPRDYKLVSIISVAIIFIILLLTFRSPLLAAILVAVIETGIWTNLSIAYFMGVKLHFMAYLIVTAIALGATVDYAILVTSKYLEEKQNGATAQAAIRNAIYRAAPGVLTSGSIFFVACLAVQLISTNIIVKQITALLARNAVFSVVLVFTFLPAILSIKERIYKLWRIKRGKGDPDEGKSNESIYSVSSKDLEKYAKEHNYALADGDSGIIEDAPVIADIIIDKPVSETIIIDDHIDNNET